MEEHELRAIWQQGLNRDEALPSVSETAGQYRRQSLNLVERIKYTARREHRIFLIIATLGVIIFLFTEHPYWAVGLLVFSGLNIWKYEAEMRLFNKIRPEEDTLTYLQNVSDLLRKFMRNYRIGILIVVPILVVGGMFWGQWWVSGSLRPDLWQRLSTWIFLVVGIVAGILFSHWWVQYWVGTFYGRKLEEMEKLIQDLKSEE
jgi:hypothetical protein